jgi:hypothetical protein
MYNRIAVVLHGIWSLVVNYLEYPIILKGGENMISKTNNTPSNIQQNRRIASVHGYDHGPLFRMQSHHNSGGSGRCKRG